MFLMMGLFKHHNKLLTGVKMKVLFNSFQHLVRTAETKPYINGIKYNIIIYNIQYTHTSKNLNCDYVCLKYI